MDGRINTGQTKIFNQILRDIIITGLDVLFYSMMSLGLLWVPR